MKNPKISIVIPVYNSEKTLRFCLNSILNQDYYDYEVIIVDNNSTDNTSEVIKEFMKKDKRIKYVFEKKRGRGAARNAGIRRARGGTILMTDSDCIVPKNWVKEMIKPILEENEKIVMGFEYDLVNNFWTRKIQESTEKFYKEVVDGKLINHLDTKNIAIKTSIAKRLMFDENLKNCEDLDFYIRLVKISRIRFIPVIRVGHYHKTSLFLIIKLNINRGFWVSKIYKKHKKNPLIKNITAFDPLSKKDNNKNFRREIKNNLYKIPFEDSIFRLATEGCWRLGMFLEYIKEGYDFP